MWVKSCALCKALMMKLRLRVFRPLSVWVGVELVGRSKLTNRS